MNTSIPAICRLCPLALLLSHSALNAAVLDTPLDPLPPVQHPALVAELSNSEPQLYDLGYLQVAAEPCLPLVTIPTQTRQLLAPTHPLTSAEAAVQQQRWRQLQHRQAELAQGPLIWCYYPVP